MLYSKKRSFSLLFLVAFMFVNAQNKSVTITGKITDNLNYELPFVNVVLKNTKNDTFVVGTITDEMGVFKLETALKGNLIIEASYIGFENQKVSVFIGELSQIIDTGKLVLLEKVASLNEVNLVYKAEAINDKMDKKTFLLHDNISQVGGSVLQALQNLPGVGVQDGKLQLRGSDKITVLIDGKQTAITGFGNATALDNLATSSIEKIEIINNPSAKYDANGNAGIINIIYKKNKSEGLTGKTSFVLGAGSLWERKANLPTIRPQYTVTPKVNPSLNLNYKKNKINSFFNFDYLYTETLNKNEFVTRTYSDGTVINQQTKRNRDTQFLTLKSGFDWEINPSDVFTFSVLYGKEKILDNGDEPFFNSNNERTRLWQFLEDELKTTFMASSAYEHKFATLGNAISLNLNYSFHREDEKYFFDNILANQTNKDAFKLLSDEKVIDFNVNYTKSFKQGKLEAGTKFRYREIPTDMNFIPGNNSVLDVNAGGKAKYQETIPALYSNYTYENKNIQTELGLRVESVNLNYYVSESHPVYKTDGYTYFQPFPSFRFSYKLNENNKLSFFYNRRVDRPNEVDIRIFPKYDDAEIIKVGNPTLKPQYTNTIELGFKKTSEISSLYISSYFKSIDATITRIAATENNISTLIYNVFQNAGKSTNLGLELVYSLKVNDWYYFNLNTNAYNNTINAFTVTNLYPTTSVYSANKQSLLTGYLKWNNFFKLKNSVSLQVSSYYYAPEIVPQGEMKSRYSVDFGLKKAIQNGKGQLFLNGTDVFNSLVLRSKIIGSNFNYTSNNYAESQVFRLGYSYTF